MVAPIATGEIEDNPSMAPRRGDEKRYIETAARRVLMGAV